MKIQSILSCSVILICGLSIWGCSKDEMEIEELNAITCPGFENRYDEVSKAFTIYSQNPDIQNCESYKAELMSLYEDYKDCSIWGGEYQKIIEDAKNLNCNGENSFLLPK